MRAPGRDGRTDALAGVLRRPVGDPCHERVVGGLHVRCLPGDTGEEHIAGCLSDSCIGRGTLRGGHRGPNGSNPPRTEATASYIAPCTIPASTVLLAGERNPGAAGGGGGAGLAEIAPSATPLQYTTALSSGANDAAAPAVDVDAGTPARPATANIAAAAVVVS